LIAILPCTHPCAQSHTHVYMYTYTDICVYTHVHMYKALSLTHAHTLTHTHKHTLNSCPPTCTYTQTHPVPCTYTHKHTLNCCPRPCTHTHTTHTHTHTHTHTQAMDSSQGHELKSHELKWTACLSPCPWTCSLSHLYSPPPVGAPAFGPGLCLRPAVGMGRQSSAEGGGAGGGGDEQDGGVEDLVSDVEVDTSPTHASCKTPIFT